MPLPEFDYLKPESMEEALDLLDKYGEDGEILAGGTDLFPDARGRIKEPSHVIDIKGIQEMSELSFDEDEGLKVGATVPLGELAEMDVLKERYGPLWSAVNELSDPVLRNRATLAGNICTASPAGDSSPALLVLDAEVEVVSKDGERRIPINEFFTGVKKNALNEGEIVKSILIPTPPEGAEGDYLKWKRNMGEDLSVVGVAVLVTDSEGGSLRIALSSVAPTPLYVSKAEDILKENETVDEVIDEAVSVVSENCSPITDVRCCEGYRSHMVEVLTKRALNKILDGEN